jgi:hypothetical protein
MSNTPGPLRQKLQITLLVLMLVAVGSIWQLIARGTGAQTGQSGIAMRAHNHNGQESGTGLEGSAAGKGRGRPPH